MTDHERTYRRLLMKQVHGSALSPTELEEFRAAAEALGRRMWVAENTVEANSRLRITAHRARRALQRIFNAPLALLRTTR
jgi:hypothetical protein